MTFALIVSHLLDPLWVMPAVTILNAYERGFMVTLVLMVFMLGIPLSLRLLYKREYTWDISTRADRPMAIAILLIILGLVNITVAALWGNSSLISLLVLYELWMAGFLVISLFWKISGHAGGIALATGLVILWYGWAWWPIFLLVPLIGWARVVTKNHTIAQVIAGTAYSFLFIVAYEAWQSLL